MSEINLTYKENLVPRIRKLIKGYTVSSILKEYLQNADDAGATELIVSFDKRAHDNLNNTRFEKAKGPALVIENNSFFREKDFESIIEISKEGKIDDASSTGRFGEGFSCSFSVSDDPSFISSGRAYWFDVLKHSVLKEQNESIKAWGELQAPELQTWLKAFLIDDSQTISSKKTIFRLPLRDSSSADESQISSEIFTFQHFLSWCEEWRNSAHNILFLRNIHRIILNEIKEDGTLVQHLSISTINHSEIEDINRSIQQDFERFSSMHEMCNHWLSNDVALPVKKYRQELLIRSESEEITEKWAVVNGLFRGPDNILVKQALKALSIKPVAQKVLPWCGVAVKLDENDLPIKNQLSKLFTFLPLDINNPYPVHIHGWFDLDDKRTQITLGRGGETTSILTSWNKLLLEHGIAHAWALLFDYVKGHSFLSEYFYFWPKRKSEPLNDELVKGFYRVIKELNSVYVRGPSYNGWIKPSDSARIFREQRNEELLNVLGKGYSIILGNVTKEIQSLLLDSGLTLYELDQDTLSQDIVKKSRLIDYPLKACELPFNFIECDNDLIIVIKYLISKDLDDWANLPISLARDGLIYDDQQLMLIEQKPGFELFQAKKQFFLCDKIIGLLDESKNFPSNWLYPNLKNVVSIIYKYFESFQLNNNWAEDIISQIVLASANERESSANIITKLKIGQCENGDWKTLKASLQNYPPILISDTEVKNYDIYNKLGISLYSRDVLHTYNKLASFKELIIEMSPLILVRHLVAHKESDFCYDEELREFVIKQLACDISWLKELTYPEKQSFIAFPLIKTDTGALRSPNTNMQLYVSSGFTAPTDIKGLNSEYEVIISNNESENRLYKALGFEALEPAKYLKEVILPFIKSHESLEQTKDALRWIVSDWKGITKNNDESEIKSLHTEIAELNIVPRESDGVLLKPRELYHPDFYQSLPHLMEHDSFKVKELNDVPKLDWLSFLKDIGLANELIPKHLIALTNDLEQEGDLDKAIDFWNYIIKNFESIKRVKLGVNSILTTLTKTKTFPVEIKEGAFNPGSVSSNLSTPNRLILQEDYSLLGLVYNSLNKNVALDVISDRNERTEIIEDLRLIAKPNQNDVFINFRKLKEIETTSKRENREVLKFAKRFYRYIGRFTDIRLPNDLKFNSVRLGNMWVSPQNVFERKLVISGTYCWSELLEGENTEQLQKGLRKLGVSTEPSIDYLVDLLNQIPKGVELTSTQLSDAQAILSYLKYEVEERDYWSLNNIPILTAEEKLFDISDVFIDDCQQYHKVLVKNNDLLFVHKKYEKLASAIGVERITSRQGRLNEKESKETRSFDQSYVKSLFSYLASSSFKSAIERIYFHENESEDIEEFPDFKIVPEHICFMEALVIDYFIEDVWIYSYDTITTFKDAQTLYILNQDDNKELWDSLAKYICELVGISDSILVLRLIEDTRDLNEVHEFLDSKGITPLGELSTDMVDDNYSIYADPDELDGAVEDGESPSESIPAFEPTTDEAESCAESIAEFVPTFGEVATQNGSIEDNASDDVDTESATSQIIRKAKRELSKPKPPSQEPPHQSGSNRAPLSRDSKEKREILSLKGRNNRSSESDIHRTLAPPTKPIDKLDEIENENLLPPGREQFSHSENSKHKPSHEDKPNPSGISPNNRIPVYMGIEEESEQSQKEKNRATEIGDKGENYLIENQVSYRTSQSNRFKKAPRNNMGYDIVELTNEDQIVRYIEVKTLTGVWGKGGVSVTLPQYEFALETDNWWLFVVEGIETQTPKVYSFENPVRLVNRFAFDSSWKQLSAEIVTVELKKPKLGTRIKLPGSEIIYNVIDIEHKGKIQLYKLESADADRSIIRKTYGAQWEIL